MENETMKKSACQVAICAAIAVAAGALCASVEQPFAGGVGAVDENYGTSLSATAGKWNGEAEVVDKGEGYVSVSPTAGSPYPTATDTKVLCVEGTVVCTNTLQGAGGDEAPAPCSRAEFLLNVTEVSDEFFSDDMTGYRAAVAVGTEIVTVGGVDCVNLYCWCRPKGAEPGSEGVWTNVATVATCTWARVTMIIDNNANMYELAVDGVPCVSEAGYLRPDAEWEPSTKGAWYPIVAPAPATDSAKKIGELRIDGIAMVDDVLVQQSGGATFGNGAHNVGIDVSSDGEYSYFGTTNAPMDSLVAWGVSQKNVMEAKLDDSGLTVSDKFVCGLDPADGSRFEILGCTSDKDDGGNEFLVLTTSGSLKESYINFEVRDGKTGDLRYRLERLSPWESDSVAWQWKDSSGADVGSPIVSASITRGTGTIKAGADGATPVSVPTTTMRLPLPAETGAIGSFVVSPVASARDVRASL